jgi:hypothetical protein
VKYDLERLGPFGFQDLCAALALRVYGAHIRPMGLGKDGGRDMLTIDPIRWSHDTVWTGMTVFQVKHKDRLTTPQSDAATLWKEIRGELDLWASPDSGRGTVPRQLVFVSNVSLSAVTDAGGFDKLSANINNWLAALSDEAAESHLEWRDQKAVRQERQARRDRMKSLRTWRILDRNHLTGMLDAYRDVRLAFDGFLQAGDVLADLSRFTTTLSEDELAPALKQHARWALTNEGKIYFDEAGADPKGFPIEQIVIDLPVYVKDADGPEKVIRYVLDRGDHLLRPSLASLDKPRHLVVVGAPGNGKTTISRFIVHAYRAAWLGEDTDLGDEHRRAVDGTVNALRKMSRSVPSNRRWPLRVDLAKFAVEKATDPDFTLLTFISQSLSKQASSKGVTKSVLAPWLKVWPSILVLDGLDEVTEPSVRKGLVADVEAFVAEAETNDSDMFVVVTSRPTGYNDELSATVFERVDLADLSIRDALNYGRLVTRVRVPDDETRRASIIGLLEAAAQEESLQRLLRTPLQVLIMSIIAESAKRFAPSRFDLFWTYYRTIEQRERDKTLGFSTLIRDHAAEVLDLHRRVGLLLQERAETATGSESILTPEDLHDAAWHVLKDAGYKPSEGDKTLLDQIVTAATHRLVLLTARPGGGFGFDVRSLQEMMAALALTTGTLDEAIPRLKRIGASPHWRNTLLFAAGRYFAEPQPHQKEAVTNLVLTLDENTPHRLGAIFPVGPSVAAEIVDDGMAAEPRYLHRLVAHALRTLDEPESFDLASFTRILVSAAGLTDAMRALIADGLRRALGGTHVPRMAAEQVQRAITALGTESVSRWDVTWLASVKRDPSKSLPAEPVADWDAFWELLNAYSDPDTVDVLNAVGNLLQKVSTKGMRKGWETDLQMHLANPDLALIVEEALAHVADASPLLIASVRHSVMPTLWRQPLVPSHQPANRA